MWRVSGSTESSGDSSRTPLADRRVAEWLFLVTLVAYAYFHAGGGWNQNAQLDLTRAIVERHTFAIDAYASNTGDVSYARGHVWANKAPALSWLAALPYAAVHAFGADNITFAAYFCTVVTVALFGALVPALLYLEAKRRGIDARWAAFVALTVALATELWPYATVFMVAVPSGALMLFAYVTPRRALGGFAAGLAAAMNYLCAPAMIILAFVRPGWRRFAAGAIAPVVALAAYQQICFGSLFTTSVQKTDPRFLAKGAALGVLGRPSLDALYGITLSPYRGFFFFAPVLLLALIPLVRERAVLAISLVFFAVNVCFNGWEGGFAIGARYLVPLIPLWGLALMHARPRWLVVALAVISFAINFAATAVDPQPSGTIPRPLTQYIVPLLLHGRFSSAVPITPPWSAATITGHTSVNRLTYDEAVLFQKNPRGSVATEWTSFNLGEPFFGAGDARSLIPIGFLLLVGIGLIFLSLSRAQRGIRGGTRSP